MTWGVPNTPVTSSGVWVTIDDIKDHIGITDTTDDDLLADLLEMAQDAIEEQYGLPTVPQVSESRKYSIRDERFCVLDECFAISGVADESGNALTSDDYTIVYGRKSTDPVVGIRFGANLSQQVSITGTWGYAVCPANVGRALVTTVGVWYKRETRGDANDVIGGFSTLPREARDLMEMRRKASIQ